MSTLEELKKANDAGEDFFAETSEEAPEETQKEEKTKAEKLKDEVAAPEEQEEEAAEEDTEEQEEQPDDSWMKGEGEEEPKFTSSDAAAIRRKYKAKVEAEKEEKQELLKRIEELEKGRTQKQAEVMKDKPKRDDFKTDDEWIEALTDYKVKMVQAESSSKTASEEQKRRQEAQQKAVSDAVDQHYIRAARLAEKSGIKPETYQAADQRLRQTVESVYPGAGDAVTDKLISLIGEGSEKVAYHLSVNPAKLSKLEASLREDNTGLAAAAYLGRLNAEISSSGKRTSTAPAPATEIQGDNAGKTSLRALADKYKEASRKGDAQKAYDIKKEAKEQGADTRGW